MTRDGLRAQEVADRLGLAPPQQPGNRPGPLVSCVLVGDGDPTATVRAARWFAVQDHPERELVLVARPCAGTGPRWPLPEGAGNLAVRVVVPPPDATSAQARDLGCSAASGALIALWEQDAWYPSWRLRYQVSALAGTGLGLSGSASALRWDPAAGEGWAGDADPRASRARLFGATVCLTRTSWAAQPLTARHGRRQGGSFVLDVPDGDFHVPRRVHPAVVVRPGSYGPEVAQTSYPRGTVELLLGQASREWGAPASGGVPAPAVPARADPRTDPRKQTNGRPRTTAPAGPALLGRAVPLVSCIMPTFNRRRFVAQAVRFVTRQDYPRLELVVVDDGAEPVEDLLAGRPWIRYVHLAERATTGHKRNVACEVADGDVVVQWDDDDWYGPQRVTRQVTEIIEGRVDVTGIGINLLLDVRSLQVWSTREQEAAEPVFATADSVAGGTLAFNRDWWGRVGGYPDSSLSEDVGLLQRFIDGGARIAAISNHEAYVYVRHGRNSWRFDFSAADGPPGWNRRSETGPLSADDLAFYASLVTDGSVSGGR